MATRFESYGTKTVFSDMEKVYPRIAYVPKVISDNGQQALVVIIPGSELRPHFAGLAYVRKGPESVDASEDQFRELIAQRNSKAALVLQWKGKNVTVFTRMGDSEFPIAQSYLSFRNHALHANWDKIEKESIHSVLGFVEQLLLKHFS